MKIKPKQLPKNNCYVLCPTCLSMNRKLLPLKQEHTNILYSLEILKSTSCRKVVCWECYAIVQKIILFKKNAIYAQKILSMGVMNKLRTMKMSTLDTYIAINKFDKQIIYEGKSGNKSQHNIIDVTNIARKEENAFSKSANEPIQMKTTSMKILFDNSVISKKLNNSTYDMDKSRKKEKNMITVESNSDINYISAVSDEESFSETHEEDHVEMIGNELCKVPIDKPVVDKNYSHCIPYGDVIFTKKNIKTHNAGKQILVGRNFITSKNNLHRPARPIAKKKKPIRKIIVLKKKKLIRPEKLLTKVNICNSAQRNENKIFIQEQNKSDTTGLHNITENINEVSYSAESDYNLMAEHLTIKPINDERQDQSNRHDECQFISENNVDVDNSSEKCDYDIIAENVTIRSEMDDKSDDQNETKALQKSNEITFKVHNCSNDCDYNEVANNSSIEPGNGDKVFYTEHAINEDNCLSECDFHNTCQNIDCTVSKNVLDNANFITANHNLGDFSSNTGSSLDTNSAQIIMDRGQRDITQIEYNSFPQNLREICAPVPKIKHALIVNKVTASPTTRQTNQSLLLSGPVSSFKASCCANTETHTDLVFNNVENLKKAVQEKRKVITMNYIKDKKTLKQIILTRIGLLKILYLDHLYAKNNKEKLTTLELLREMTNFKDFDYLLWAAKKFELITDICFEDSKKPPQLDYIDNIAVSNVQSISFKEFGLENPEDSSISDKTPGSCKSIDELPTISEENVKLEPSCSPDETSADQIVQNQQESELHWNVSSNALRFNEFHIKCEPIDYDISTFDTSVDESIDYSVENSAKIKSVNYESDFNALIPSAVIKTENDSNDHSEMFNDSCTESEDEIENMVKLKINNILSNLEGEVDQTQHSRVENDLLEPVSFVKWQDKTKNLSETDGLTETFENNSANSESSYESITNTNPELKASRKRKGSEQRKSNITVKRSHLICRSNSIKPALVDFIENNKEITLAEITSDLPDDDYDFKDQITEIEDFNSRNTQSLSEDTNKIIVQFHPDAFSERVKSRSSSPTEKVKIEINATQTGKESISELEEDDIPLIQFVKNKKSQTKVKKKKRAIYNKIIKILIDKVEAKKLREQVRDSRRYKESAFKCDKCLKCYSNKTKLIRHGRFHKETKGRAYACDICEYRFHSQRLLDAHGVSHLKGYQCLYCKNKYLELGDIYEHVRDVHSATKGSLKCHRCQLQCRTQAALRRHFNGVHAAETTFDYSLSQVDQEAPTDIKSEPKEKGITIADTIMQTIDNLFSQTDSTEGTEKKQVQSQEIKNK